MNKLNGQKLVELVGLEASNKKVLDSLQALGMEMPLFDEKFEIDGHVAVYDDAETVDIVFVKNNNHSHSGEPVVEQVDFYNEDKAVFPLGLHKENDYKTAISIIGRNPDFCDKDWKESKQWILGFINGKEISMGVNFKKDFKGGINNIVVSEFIRDGLEEDPYIFPCKELEQ